MSPLVAPTHWRPLGSGRIAAAGSVSDGALFARVAGYKRTVAGTYVSLSPGDVATRLPPGPCVISEKVDGETWFLHHDGTAATLVSPAGRAISGVALTEEAASLLGSWAGLLAGELYVHGHAGRPRVMDLHAALGGGTQAPAERLRFAAFDLLVEGETATQHAPLADRVSRLTSLLDGGSRLHVARFETISGPAGVAARFAELVTRGGAEGLVVHAGNGRTYKVKSELTLDAAVVGYAASEHGVSELLLALLTSDGSYQSIGRVRTGWRSEESRELAASLGASGCPSSYRAATDRGTLLGFVRPQLVVEIRCNELLVADSKDEPIRRMRLAYADGSGWSALGPSPSVSLQNAVFLRVRNDKQVRRPDVRFEQVSELVTVPAEPTGVAAPLPASQLLRREVYTKTTRSGLAVRKLVAWRTNKHELDSRFPAFAVLLSDYSPGRAQPLQKDLRVASSETTLHAFADDWLAQNIRRGWLAATVMREPELEHHAPDHDSPAPLDEKTCAGPAATGSPRPMLAPPGGEPRSPPTNASGSAHEADEQPPSSGGDHANVEAGPPDDPAAPNGPRLTLAFNRSSSPTFPLVRRRLDLLAPLGSLAVTRDDHGRELSFDLTLSRGLVEAARRIGNLLVILRGWKTTEVSLDGDLLNRQQQLLFIESLERVRLCWLRRKSQGPQGCRRSTRLGCHALHLEPSREDIDSGEPRWFGVGRFDGQHVLIDKQQLRDQVAGERNAQVRLCPFFDAQSVDAAIDGLPEALSADDPAWTTLYDSAGKPVWLWPSSEPAPWRLRKASEPAPAGDLHLRLELPKADSDLSEEAAESPPTPPRTVPPTRYSDVLGQDPAVEAARDTIELPLKHADLFLLLGATPRGHGILLAGPPGTGKTLLARAVAGECGAHIEIVNGPALLSKWLGQTEAALRAVFERARNLAPAVILFDELDSIAPSRAGDPAQHDVSIAAQLLVLLDGLESRGQVIVLGTTNRPEQLDPALRRPGRFDQVIWMELPDLPGRAAIFEHYLRPLKLASRLDPHRLAAELAARAPGFSGADIAFVCHRAALLCVKQATSGAQPPGTMAIARPHFLAALAQLAATQARC